MTYRTMYDAARPPDNPPDTEAVLVYAVGDATHIWTDAEITAQGTRGRMPCAVYAPGRNGTDDAKELAGWLDFYSVPDGAAVMLDMEAYVDLPYLTDFSEHLGAKVQLLLYGSLSTLFANGGSDPAGLIDGWFPADWTGHPHLFAHDLVLGTQYAAAQLHQTVGNWDLDMISPAVKLWTPADKSADPLLSVTTSGHDSLASLAVAERTTIGDIMLASGRQVAEGEGWPAAFERYLDSGDLTAAVPADIKLHFRHSQ